MRRLHTSRTGSRLRDRAGTPRRWAWLAALWLTGLLGSAAHGQTLPVTSGLYRHFKADAGVSTDGSGNVTVWTDQSPAATTAIQSGSAQRPALVAAGLNGRPTLRFDGTDDLLTLTSSVDLSSGGLSVFIAGRNAVRKNYNGLFRIAPALSGNAAQMELYWQAGSNGSGNMLYIANRNSSGSSYTNFLQADNTGPTAPAPYIYGVSAAATGTTTRGQALNGTTVSSTTGSGSYLPASANSAWLGVGFAGASTVYLQGDISEVIIYNREVTAAEQVQIETYLSNKYNIATAANPTPLATTSPVTSGLRLHLAADLGVTSSAGTVSTWADISGNGFDVAQATAGQRPALAANAVNSKPALTLDGSDDWLQSTASVDLLAAQTNYTFFAVTKPGTSQKTYADIFDYTHSSGVRFVIQQDGSSTNQFYNNGATAAIQTLPTAGFSIYGSTFVNGGATASRLNGGNQLSTTSSTNSFGAPAAFRVGNWSSAGREFNGQIAEVLVYNRVLTAAEIRQVEGYLGTKYAITLAVPTVASLSPGNGAGGTAVSISGTNLTEVTGVLFGGVAAPSFTASSGTSLSVLAPSNGNTGPITLQYGSGQSVASSGSFTYLSTSANISRVEYFVDSDPGFGAATAFTLPATPAGDLPGLSATVSLSSLSAGFHTVGVRSQDDNGAWSLTNRRTFYYEPAALNTLPNITKVEYFVDTDPGFAAAIDVPVTANADISGIAFNVNISSLTAGFHTVGVRSRDANGQWSLTNRRTFYYEPAALNTLPNITKVEYFIDTDPGFAAAIDVPVTAGTDISGIAFNVNISSLTAGFHQLGVRSRDANGQWSLTNRRTFYYEPAANNTLANITKVEYFIDAEPGFGSGIDVPVTAATDISGLAFGVNLGSLPAGFHSLSVRSRDANGKWSLTNIRSFYYEPVLAAAPNVNKIEFYFDNDPGFGSATDVPVPTPAQDLANFSFVADASGLADGAHRIFFRSRDANGKWSLVSSRSFVKNGCASSANFSAGLATSSYNYGGSTNGLAETAFNTDPATPTTGNTFYGYNGSALQADLGSAQTISELRLKLTPSATGTYTVQLQTAASIAGPFTTVDTYSGSLVAGATTNVTRTLATPATARVVRLVLGTPSNYLIVSGVGTYYFNCAGPTITSFTPTGGPAGTSVAVTGTNFTGATGFTFNGVAAQSFTVNSATSITAIAPNAGSTGQLCVTTPSGTACSAANYTYPPTIATGTVSPSSFCSSTFISVPFTTNTTSYGAGNVFNFQLSDANGVFTAGSRLYGSLVSSSASGGTLQDSIAFRTPAGTGYRVRVVASNPAITGTDNGTNLTIRATPMAAASANSPVVFNGTIQLVAQPTGQSSYQWYVNYTSGGGGYVGNGQTLNLTNAQPTQSGKYFVYVQNSGGCQDSASVRVLVQPNAVPVLTMGQFSYTGCAGATFNVGFSVTGNNFANGNTISAQLSDASGSFAAPVVIGSAAFTGQGGGSISSTIPTNTPTGTGYRIRLVGSTPSVTSTTDNGSNIGLTTQPTASASSNSPVAYNGTIQLTAAPVAGASYQWYGPGFAAAQQNPTIPNATPSNSGTYSLYVTVNGCTSPVSSTQVTVNPSAQPILAIAQFGGSLCPGTGLNIGFSVTGNVFGAGNTITAQLSDASGSFASPVTIGSVVFTGQGNGSVSTVVPQGTTAGTGYRIRLVGSNPGVTSTTDNGTNLSVPTTLVASASSNSPIASGGTLQLNAGPNGAASYQWFVLYTAGGGGLISNQQNPTFNNVTTASSGFYYVYVTQGGCTDSASVRVLVNPPTTTTLALGAFSGQFCAGSNYAVNFTVGGAGLSSGTITAQLSDASGSFGAPVSLGSVNFNGTGNGSLGFTMPATTLDGPAYRIRLISTNPALTSNDNGTNLTISNLTNVVASSNSPVAAGALIQFSSGGVPAGATIGWTGPNSFSSSQPNPSINNANAANAGTYSFTVSLNGCSVTRQVQLVVGSPTIVLATGNVSGSLCPGSAITVPYTVTTGSLNGGNTFTVQLSNASGSFASPVVIGSLSSNAGSSTIAAVIPSSTPAGSGYRVRVVADNPATVGSDNGANLTVGTLTFAWTGAGGNTNWFDAANWSCGQVPNATSVVTIPGGLGNYPVVTGGTAVALHITIANTATFTVNSSFNLYGNVTNNGTVLAGTTSTWSFVGGSQTISGNALQIGSFVINTGVTLNVNAALNIYGSWTNNGSYLGNSGYNVVFNGAGGPQVIGGTSITSFYNLFVSSGAVVNLGINTVFLGNVTATGTFNATGYGVAFDGTTAQTIGGSGTVFYGVTINNLVGVSLVNNITVLGDWLNFGQFSGGTYSVIFAGTVAQVIGGSQITNFYNVTFQNAISVTLHQNIYVLGGFVNTGVFYGWYLNGSSTNGFYVRFGGSAAQVITANTTTYFYHFYVDNLAGVSLATNIYIAGNYYLYSGSFNPATYTVYFNGNEGSSYVQTVGGYTGLTFYGWNILGTTSVRLLQDVTWLGSFANAGTFYGYNYVGGVYMGYTCVFGGSAAQAIGGTGLYEFWHVTWSNLAGITLNQNISVWGNWRNNGGYFANGYLVNFIGTLAQTIGGTVNTIFHHVTITNALSVSLLQPITVLGNWAGSGVFLGNGYLVYFNGTAAQTIFCGADTRFFDLRFNNPTTVTLLTNIYLLGNWTHDGGFVANGYRVFFGGTGATQVIAGTATTLFHHLTILTGAQVQLGRVVTILGDWTNHGSFLHGNYTVTFAGSIAQLINGGQVTNFYGITFLNTGTVTLGSNIRVAGAWTNSGVFVPATYTVFFNGSIAQVIGGSAVTTFFGLNILNTTGGVSLSGPIFIQGNLVNDGLFSCANYLVTFNGTALQNIGGLSTTIFGNITTNNAVGVALGQNIRVRGDFRNLALFTAGGYIVYFDGSIAQGIYSTGTLTFHDVVFANLNGVTLQNNIFLTGNWTNNGGFLANGKLVTFSGSVLQLITGSVATVFHHFTIALGATVQQNLGITLLGDWTNNGSFLHNNLLVYFNGTVLQTIAGTALSIFYDVTFNNAVNVSLGHDIDVVRNFVNSGGYCGCGFRTRFNGTVPQTITCSSGRTHFHDITFDNLQGVTLLDGIYVSGRWVNNGGYLANNQLVIFDGTTLQSIGGTALTAFWNVQVTNLLNVQLLHDITVGGYFTNNGVFSGNGFLTTFVGPALQTITTSGAGAITTFHHVTWANLVGCVLAGDIYVTGNWLCNGPFNPATWTVYFNGTVAQTCGGAAQIRFFGLSCSNPTGVTCNGPVYLYGNFVNTGLVSCGTYGWYCVGTGPQTIGGISATPTRFYDLYIQNASGVTATDNFFLTHVLTLNTGNLASNGHLTLTSNATGTAMVINPVGGGVVTGVATMERFITGLSGAAGYRHYSSPMKLSGNGISTTVQEFADDLPVFELNPAYNTAGNTVTPFPTLFKYDETRLTAARPGFDEGYLVPGANEDLQPLRGYTAQTLPTTTVDIAGLLNTGTVSYNLTRGSLANAGWHLLGNPYPAPMDWDVVRATSGMLSGVADALYVFQPSGTYTGTYKAYVNGLGQNGGSKDLAAMQGFFVRATAPTAAVSLTNAVRATSYGSPTFERQGTGTGPIVASTTTGTTARPVLRLEARNMANRTADETVIYFEAAAALGFSPQHDAYKVQLNGNGRPSLWSQAGTESFAINGLPALASAPVIPLGVRVSVDGAHELVLTGLADAPAGTQVWLEDRVLNRSQNLAANATYAFSMLANYAGQRFYLNFVAASPLAVTTGRLEARTALYPNPTTGKATLELAGLREQGAVKVEVVNVLGQTVQTLSTRPKQGFLTETLNLSGLPTGIYTVRIHAQEGTVVKRLVKE